jgi:membrane-associated phospholipid phosphatase
VQSWQQNVMIVLPIAVVQSVVYLAINRFPQTEPRAMPRIWIDDATPFWTWTLWAYYGFIVGQIVMAILVRDRTIFRQAILAYAIAMVSTLLIHLLWPTHIVRPDPSPDGTFHTWAYRLLLECDTPNSCFPSAHVCGPVVIFWAYWRDGRWLGGWLLFIVLPVVTLSILTTKQHYFWDLLGGWGLGLLAVGVVSARPLRSLAPHRVSTAD